MKNLKDIILEKLKVSANTDLVSFSFSELCDSILRFVKTHSFGSATKDVAYKFGVEHIVKLYALDYFKDNPLIIQDATPLDLMFRLQGCKVGSMCLNTQNPDCIKCVTTDRSRTLKDHNAVDKSFEITEETFNKVFNTNDLENLYEILNEEI